MMQHSNANNLMFRQIISLFPNFLIAVRVLVQISLIDRAAVQNSYSTTRMETHEALSSECMLFSSFRSLGLGRSNCSGVHVFGLSTTCQEHFKCCSVSLKRAG